MKTDQVREMINHARLLAERSTHCDVTSLAADLIALGEAFDVDRLEGLEMLLKQTIRQHRKLTEDYNDLASECGDLRHKLTAAERWSKRDRLELCRQFARRVNGYRRRLTRMQRQLSERKSWRGWLIAKLRRQIKAPDDRRAWVRR